MTQKIRASRVRRRSIRAGVFFTGVIVTTAVSGALMRGHLLESESSRQEPKAIETKSVAALPVANDTESIPAMAMLCDGMGDRPPVFDSSKLSLSFSADIFNKYYFRGILQQDHGFIIQPALELSYAVTDELTVFVGTWNSVHGETGSSSDSLRHWYECDIYAGASLSLEKWTINSTITAYLSPADSFDTVYEINFGAVFDDSSLWNNKFALNPEALIAFELGDVGADGGDAGVYFQLGIAPAFECPIAGDHILNITVPMTVGFSLDDYYEDADGDDHTFGYFDVGVDASYTVPHRFMCGEWTFSGGVHALILGNGTREINGGDKSEVIARFGISASF